MQHDDAMSCDVTAGGVGGQGRGGNLGGAQQRRVGDGWSHERPHTAQREGEVVFRRKRLPLGEKITQEEAHLRDT